LDVSAERSPQDSPDPIPGGLPLEVAERLGEFTGREWVFRAIDEWLARVDAPLFLLCGGPGTGKSVLAARLVQLARGEADAGGFRRLGPGFLTFAHFCRALDPFAVDPLRFVEGFSEQLARLSPSYRRALANLGESKYELVGSVTAQTAAPGSQLTGVKATLEIGERSAEVAFVRDVPLTALQEDGIAGPLVVLVDALDEALTFCSGETLVTLLRAIEQAKLPVPIRLILTSRDDPRVLDELGEPALALAMDTHTEADDIDRYAARRLPHLTGGRGETVAAKVVAHGKGNFLYARYVLDELVEQPDLDPETLDLPEGLEGHYRRFLERELARSDEEWKRHRPLLSLLAIARGEGLTPLLLRAASLSRSEVDDAIRVLHQYLAGRVPDGPFRLYHQSFRDFLIENGARSVDIAEAEGMLATFLLDEYGAEWHGERSYERSYALAHLPVHLAAALVGAELRREQEALRQRLSALLSDLAFLETKADRLGVESLLADFRAARELLPQDARIRQMLHMLGREAHNLRGWQASASPAYFAQRLQYRAAADGLWVVAKAARERLQQLAAPHLELCWAAVRESRALASILTGHEDSVNDVALTADGRAVSVSDDKTVRVWDLASGRQLHVLAGHEDTVTAVALTADGRAVSASEDQTLRVWDLASGRQLHVLAGHEDTVTAVALTADGRAVSASEDRTLRVWDLASGVELQVLAGHEARVEAVAITADGRPVSGSWDGTLRVWDLESGDELHVLAGHGDWVVAVALTADGRAVSASEDGMLRVWDLTSGHELHVLTGHEEGVKAVALTPDERAVSASEDGTLRVWDLVTGEQLHVLAEHEGWVWAVALTADGRAVSASDDETLRVWDLATGDQLHVLVGHEDTVNAVALTADGRAISASDDWTLRGWDLGSGDEARVLAGHEGAVNAVALTADGRAISASEDQTLRVWDLERGDQLHVLAGHEGGVKAVAVTADGRAVTASDDETLRVWDLVTGDQLHVLAGHLDAVNAVALTADGRAVSGSNDRTLRVWDLESGHELHVLEHEDWVKGLALTAEGRAVSASDDGTLRVWDLTSGHELHVLTGHEGGAWAVALTADGRAVTASDDQTLRVWDLTTGDQLHVLAGHEDWVEVIALTPDGRAISGSYDGTLRVWDLESGDELHVLRGHEDTVNAVALTAEGRAVSGSDDRTLRVWDLESGRELNTKEGATAPAAVTLEAEVWALATAPGSLIVAGDRAGNVYCFRHHESDAGRSASPA
jgi:WD40 repeat protein